jgi:signal transduction histidine kinase
VTPAGRQNSPQWYRSFYWRIGLSFMVLVVVVLVAQSAMFNYLLTRSRESRRDQSPNNFAAIVAADVGSTLTETPSTDLQQFVLTQYGGRFYRVFLVMKDGRTVSNTSGALPDGLRQSVEAVLNGTDLRKAGRQPIIDSPVVTAPIQVAGELRGMVVLPPPAFRTATGALGRDVARLLSVPGTAVLIFATALAAAVIFAPARRRLRALERATERLGSGDLTVRAPESGGDEIARVAAAFNRMASELAERDEALRASDCLRRQMLADVSHELKTPLTAMRGYLETLRMPDLALDQQTRERYFQTIEHETLRLDCLVKDLVDLARVEHAAGALDVRWFAIGTVFAHAIERHDYDARARHITIRSCTAPDADQILGDPDRLTQVVENLVANGLRHTPDGGTIELGARTTNHAFVLTVADSGVGIAPEHVPHVFDRFYKVDAARTHGESGSGLGLSIVKAIVDAHHGTIAVVSRPGCTVFTIELPRDQSTSTNL